MSTGKDDTPLVQKWICGAESHNQTRGFHCHSAIHLKRLKRWRNVRKRLTDTYNIKVDFREFGQLFYHAYTYVTKIDPYFKTSPGHPCLDNLLRAGLNGTTYAKQRNAANKPQKSGPQKNSLVLMWRCSMALLSKTKSEPMMNLFCSVKNKPWKARGISSNDL